MICKALYLTILSTVFFASAITAHPLGNFSINQYSRIESGSSTIKIRQILDMAEIPTFQQSPAIDTDRDGKLSQDELNAYAERVTPDYIKNLQLRINGELLPLNVTATEIAANPGAGNLPILRITWDISAGLINPQRINQVSFQNGNYPERFGWNEVVIQRQPGVNVFDSDAYGNGLSDELRAYPQDSLNAPLTERSASFSFTADSMPSGSKPLLNRDGRSSVAVPKDRLAELISVPEITPAITIVGLLIAFGLGAIHAMSPGHGKTVVGAYLVGSKGTVKHALFLGTMVTITHTLGVFVLGLITLLASNLISPERIMPFLSFISGLLVFYIGLNLLKSRFFSLMGWNRSSGHPHSHHDHAGHDDDGRTHTHDGHTHTHLPPETITRRNLLALGISGGLLPCPSALVLMLSAISLNRVGYGLVLTVVFSLGLAATLTAVGIAFLYLGKLFDRPLLSQSRMIRALPVFSALLVACLGAVICYNSLA